MEEIREAAFRRTLEDLGAPDADLAAAVTQFYLERRLNALRPYDDVPTLAGLQDRYQLGPVSNGNSYPDRVGLDGHFTFAFFAHDHGVRKPERAFYEAVLAHIGCAGQELVHVGDSLENDVVAAHAVGARAVWLDRHGRGNGTSVAWAEIGRSRSCLHSSARGGDR